MKIGRAVPGVRMLARYRAGWLRRDAIAGLVLTALLVPQGMAYAQLAGLPPITGLYTTILCLVGYAAFGPSRILVLGPDSSLGLMIAATIVPIVGSNGDPDRAIALVSMLALLVGAFTIIAGVLKLGFVADLLSKRTRIGYMNGLALTILIGQLPKLFGFSVSGDSLIDEARGFVNGLADGEAVGAAVAIGLVSLAVILVLARVLPKIPGVLVAVVVAIGAAAALDLGDHGVSLVGALPEGFPPLTVPSPVSDIPLLVAGAVGIAIVALADTISTASAFAARTGQEVDGNGEMIGIGAANVAAGLFQGFPVSTSGFAHRGRRAGRRQDTGGAAGRPVPARRRRAARDDGDPPRGVCRCGTGGQRGQTHPAAAEPRRLERRPPGVVQRRPADLDQVRDQEPPPDCRLRPMHPSSAERAGAVRRHDPEVSEAGRPAGTRSARVPSPPSATAARAVTRW